MLILLRLVITPRIPASGPSSCEGRDQYPRTADRCLCNIGHLACVSSVLQSQISQHAHSSTDNATHYRLEL